MSEISHEFINIKITNPEPIIPKFPSPKVQSENLGKKPPLAFRRSQSFSYSPQEVCENRPSLVLPKPKFNIAPEPIISQPEIIERTHKLYEIWPGQNRFYCFGNCITGPSKDLKYTILTWIIILIFTGVYCVIAVPALLKGHALIIPVFSGVFLLLTIIFFLLTSLSDPGIIPRKEIFELFGPVPLKYTARVLDQCLEPRFQHTPIEQQEVLSAFKYCPTCKIFRPPRASHCMYCDCCIEVFDHHCPFVGNCIGKRNYRFFVVFLFSLVLYGFTVIAGFVLTGITGEGSNKVIGNRILLIVLIAILGFAMLVVLCLAVMLLVYHIFLVCRYFYNVAI